jgi:hypothetical protein
MPLMGWVFVLGGALMLNAHMCAATLLLAGWLAAPDKWFVLVMLIQNAVPTGGAFVWGLLEL